MVINRSASALLEGRQIPPRGASMNEDKQSRKTQAATASAGSPFCHRIFTVLWIATVISNIGTWMYSAAAGALTAPAWQAIVPQLVPTQDLSGAIVANSVGINISRAM